MLLNKPQKTMILCSAFIAGCGAYLLDLIPLLAVISVLLISFLVYKKVFSVKFSVLCLIILVLSIFYCNFKTPKPDELYKFSSAKNKNTAQNGCGRQNYKNKFKPKNIYLQGRVVTEPNLNLKGRSKFEFQVYSYKFDAPESHWNQIKAKTIVNIYDKTAVIARRGEASTWQSNILIGDVLEVKGYVKPPFEATNPGQFDYQNYLKNQGIFTLTSVKYNDFKIIKHPKWGKWYLIQSLNKIKNKIIDENRKYIKSPKLEVLEGMVFGDFAVPAPDEIKQEFMKSGLLHLLAASGMNVGFIFGAWFFIASFLRIPYKPKMIAGAILVAFYSLLTGLPPSIMRAAIMAEFLILAKLLDRKADTLIILVFVCALMLLINPFWLSNVSFQLSFITTFGILLCVPPLLEKTKSIPEGISGIVIVPLVAQIWASPIQIFHFNNFSTYSLLANILVVPFVGIITFLGFTGSVFSFVPVIGGTLCMIFDKIAEPVINIILFISGFVSNLPNALYYVAKPEISTIIIFYGFILILLFVIKKNFSSKKINIISVILFLILLIFVFKTDFNRKLELVFFDVGQGDAILVQTPDNKNILVDTGPNENYLPSKTILLPYLRSKGINKLEAIVLTHPDSDHIGGTLELLKNIKVNNIFQNGLDKNSKTCRKIKRYIQENHIKNKTLYDGDNIYPDKDVNIKVIRSDKKLKNNSNEDCIILYISYKNFSSLLMADSEADSIYEIQKYVNKPLNIIKIGHHGSYNSLNYHFLNYLKPELAVISVGKKGYKYGHPNCEILEELKEFNVKTLRTDRDFAVTISSDGKNYTYKTFSTTKNR